MESTGFNQDDTISSSKGKDLKLIDLGSNILSIESDVNIRIGKRWTSIDRLSIIWKSDLSINHIYMNTKIENTKKTTKKPRQKTVGISFICGYKCVSACGVCVWVRMRVYVIVSIFVFIPSS